MLLSWCEAWGASFLIIAFVAAANPFYPLFADVGVDPRFLRKGGWGIMGFLRHLCPSHVHSAGFLGSKFQRAYESLVGSGSTSKSLLQHLSQHSAGAFSCKFAQWIGYSRAYPIWVGSSSIGDTRFAISQLEIPACIQELTQSG
jgi:hypothetical protein